MILNTLVIRLVNFLRGVMGRDRRLKGILGGDFNCKKFLHLQSIRRGETWVEGHENGKEIDFFILYGLKGSVMAEVPHLKEHPYLML